MCGFETLMDTKNLQNQTSSDAFCQVAWAKKEIETKKQQTIPTNLNNPGVGWVQG